MSDNVSNLPKRYQHYVQAETPQPPAPLIPAPQRYDVALPDDTETAVQPQYGYGGDVTPPYRMPLTQAPLSGPVETYDEREPIVWMDDAYGRSVPMRKSAAPPPVSQTPPRDLSPQPLLDPGAQKIFAIGVGGGVLLWGAGQFLLGLSAAISAAAGAGASVFAVALLLLASKLRGGRRSGGDTFITNNKNSLWGRSSTHN